MINVLLFANNNLESDGKRDERIDAFAQTLNDAFRQYQKLWQDYKELSEKCKESQSSFSNNLNKVQSAAEEADALFNRYSKRCGCTATAKGNLIPEKESLAISKERRLNCDVVTVEKNRREESPMREDNEIFQVFSQDFCTQGLEESFVNQEKAPLQEIQNITPKRSRSPILGAKKGKTRVTPTSASSPNLSQTSVVILNDFTNRSTSNPSLGSAGSTISTKTVSSPILLSSPALRAGITPPPRNIKKWGISTIHNVHTDIIVGTNKKLKQSRLFMKTEKVTDLSICDDVCVDKSEARDSVTESRGVNKNLTQKNNDCLEDSVIQDSPENEKSVSKMRHRMNGRNKSSEILQPKLNIDANTGKDVKGLEIRKSMDEAVSQTDTDVTIFDPKIASTQYTHFPSCSKTLGIEKSLVKDKTSLGERVELENEGVNDSNVIDETMFLEDDFTPASSRSEEKLNFEKSSKKNKKKLSLKKSLNAYKNPEKTINNKEISRTAIDTPVDASCSDELNGTSPPRKKIALNNFQLSMKKKNKSPTYVYKGSPVRKKADRALLNGWTCLECQKYYDAMGLDPEELQKRQNKCSRHRSKFNEKKLSQQDYWNPDFSSSYHSTMWNDD